jgi:hypothetical protein
MALLEKAMSNRVSLVELAASDIRLRPSEAVAVVSAICDQHIAGTLPGIPSPGVIRLTRDGDLVVEGPITTSQDAVTRAALLLTDLLPDIGALPEYRASGALRLVVARALGTMDLPPYASLHEFRAALSRFVTEDVREVARALFSAWERGRVTRAFKGAPRVDLTISDIRRARRATGVSLRHLAAVAEVAPTRLRDLEWGYMRDWPATAEARAQVIRYARAAGLDEAIVLSIAWPMIVEHAASGPGSSSTALVPAGPRALAIIEATPVPPPRYWRAAIVAAAATVALLAAFGFGWRSSSGPPRGGLQVDLSGQPPPAAVTDREAAAAPLRGLPVPVSTTGGRESPRVVPVAAASRVEPAPAAGPAKPKRRRPPANRAEPREEPRKASVFERELFRIVIR